MPKSLSPTLEERQPMSAHCKSTIHLFISPDHVLTLDASSSLPSGFPRQAGTWVEIGGVRSAFPMPEVLSVALGGGTKIDQRDGKVAVGPESVGHRLLSEGRVFGGKTLTTTGMLMILGGNRPSLELLLTSVGRYRCCKWSR